jgi:4'-phosphopantetheinyl transferase
VDIEALPQIGTANDVITLLHPDERIEILEAEPSERSAVFGCIWTRKEAYLKGIGIGITADLASDYLGAGGRAASPSGWTVASIPVSAGYAGAVAVRGTSRLTVHDC